MIVGAATDFYSFNINVNERVVYRADQTGMFRSRFTELHGSMMGYSPGIGNRANKTVDTVRRLAALFDHKNHQRSHFRVSRFLL